MHRSEFTYTSRPARIVFGAGSLQHLAREVDALGLSRLLVLSTPGHADEGHRVAALLEERSAGVFAKARMHVPADIAREGCALARQVEADGTVAIGGGSTVGLGKAIALELGLPLVAIPTTYAGSEVTTMYGITEGGAKRTGLDARVLPRTVIYDPELTLTLPVALSVTSGINAIAHAVEGLYSREGSPIVDLMAEEGIATLAGALPRIVANATDGDARVDALRGSWLCGTVMGSVPMALHHKLCHTLGGTFDLPHAQTHTIVLPHALAYNAPAVPDAVNAVARALGTDDAPRGLYELARRGGVPVALADIGMREVDLDRAADLALANPYWNPRPVERMGIRKLLQDAFDGREPAGAGR